MAVQIKAGQVDKMVLFLYSNLKVKNEREFSGRKGKEIKRREDAKMAKADSSAASITLVIDNDAILIMRVIHLNQCLAKVMTSLALSIPASLRIILFPDVLDIVFKAQC